MSFPEVALLAWIPVAALAFSLVRPTWAALFTYLGGMLILPEDVAFDAPFLPPVGKQEMAAICLLIGAVLRVPDRLRKARPGRGPDWIFVVLIASTIATVLTNTDPLPYGEFAGYSLTPYDIISMTVRDLLRFGLPFFLGRALIRTRRDLHDLMVAVVAAGIVYSLFILVELRLSPQLHYWVYGYYQTHFFTTSRSWGYRPMVFMSSGLALGIFMAIAAIAAATLARARVRVFAVSSRVITPILTIMLVLCKSYAAIVYGLAAIPVVFFASPRLIRTFASVCVFLVVSYPAARAVGVFPSDQLVAIAESIDPDRAQSLEFRFDNEDMLLEHAFERPLFGWGAGGRNRVFDVRTGGDRTIIDGFWILWIGTRGLIGWGLIFALLLVPVVYAGRKMPKIPRREDRAMLLGLGVMISVYTVDLLPNSLFSNFPIFLAGALFNGAKSLSTPEQKRTRPFADGSKRQRPESLAQIPDSEDSE